MTPWRFEGAQVVQNREISGSFRSVSRIIWPVPERGRGRRRPPPLGRRRGYRRSWRSGRRGSGGRLRLGCGIDPAGVNAAVKRLGHLGVDLAAKAGQAAERRLDMAAWAAEPVVEIEVTKGGVEIVEPHQAHHAATEPDAFGVSGRPVDGLRRLDEFIGLALIFLGSVGGLGRDSWPRLAGLVLGVASPLWAKALPDTDQEGEPGDGEVAQNRILKLKHPTTHKFPDLLPARGQL